MLMQPYLTLPDSDASVLHQLEHLQAITHSTNDAIISSNERGIILSWNPAAEKLFGYAEQEALGRPLSIIIPVQFRKQHEQGLRRVALGGPRHVIGQTVELLGMHISGRVFPIELSLSTWQSEGRACFCGIIRDISSRKQSEAEVLKSRERLKEQARKLRAANKLAREKNQELESLSNKLAKYLSRQVYDSIFQGKRDVKIESYRKKLTVFFSDIHDFSGMADRVEPEVLAQLLNRYLDEMSKIALEYGGTIDKYIGDAIMIFFGDPESLGERGDAIACVKMALAMKRKLSSFQREWEKHGIGRPFQVRMGINSGFCTVGNFGSEERLDYTIVGGEVNLASRLESAAKAGQILISHHTYALVKEEISCRKKGEARLKGIAYPVQTYEVVGLQEELKQQGGSLQTELDGFQLQIDFQKLNGSDKSAARVALEEAIARLQHL